MTTPGSVYLAPAKTASLPHALLWLAAAGFLLALGQFTTQQVLPIQIAYAAVLLFTGTHALLYWVDKRPSTIPAWPLICGVHFIFYGLAIFSASRISPSKYDRGVVLADSTLTESMLLGVIGLLSMGLGRMLASRVRFARDIRLNFITVRAVTPGRFYALLFLGAAANIFGVPIANPAVRNLFVVALDFLPLAAFLWVLLASILRGPCRLDVVLCILFFGTRMLAGAGVGVSLATVMIMPLLMGLAALAVNRRLPWGLLALAFLLFVFLQPSKGRLREELAFSGEPIHQPVRIMLRWIKLAASGWGDALSGRTPLDEQFTAATSRSSLLTLVGVVVDKTPDLVPYQYGQMYPLLLQNMVPRVLWPNKPTTNAANRFFQVQYGLTDEEDLTSVSIACGFESEGYMNFGWLGVVAASLFVGFFFHFYECAFFTPGRGIGAIAVGLALLPGFLAIESQLVTYLGGILQFIVAAVVLFRDTDAAAPVRLDHQEWRASAL